MWIDHWPKKRQMVLSDVNSVVRNVSVEGLASLDAETPSDAEVVA